MGILAELRQSIEQMKPDGPQIETRSFDDATGVNGEKHSLLSL